MNHKASLAVARARKGGVGNAAFVGLLPVACGDDDTTVAKVVDAAIADTRLEEPAAGICAEQQVVADADGDQVVRCDRFFAQSSVTSAHP